MNAALLTPSKYIKAVALQGKDKTVTITGVKLEELEREDNTKETKGLISIAESAKKWVLNVTNVKCLVAMFGQETDLWIGKHVTLYPEPNEMSDSGFAIRIRGSPDLAKPVTFTLKLARKKPKKKTLIVTSANGSQPAAGATPTDGADSFMEDAEPTDEQLAAQEPLDLGGVAKDGRIVP